MKNVWLIIIASSVVYAGVYAVDGKKANKQNNTQENHIKSEDDFLTSEPASDEFIDRLFDLLERRTGRTFNRPQPSTSSEVAKKQDEVK